MKRATNGFPELTLGNFSKQLAVIIASMTGNVLFTSLQPLVVALKAAADNFAVLVTNAEKRDRDAVIERNTARIEITNLLHDLGFDVTAIAKGNEAILSSSGFPFTKPTQKSNPLQKPNPPKVFAGVNNGAIGVRTSAQKGMKSLKYYISSNAGATELAGNEEASWDAISWNSTKYTFTDLAPGQRYFIKVGLVGVRGQEVVSDAVSFIPQ